MDGGHVAATSQYALHTTAKADALSLSIAAASVVAKVTRDRIMRGLAQRYPGYGWETNVGYSTAERFDGMQRLGVTPHPRRPFPPVRPGMSGDADVFALMDELARAEMRERMRAGRLAAGPR